MKKDFLASNISPRKILVYNILLYSTTMFWWFLFYQYVLNNVFSVFDADVKWSSVGIVVFFISIAIFTLIGGVVSERIERKKLFTFWTVTGLIIPPLFIIFQDLTLYIFLTVILGASFGIGFPSCNAVIVDYTSIEERGRVYGIAYFVFLVTLSTTGLILESLVRDLNSIYLLLGLSCITRLLGICLIRLYPDTRKTGKVRSWSSILTTNRFLLYLIPWVIVNLLNAVGLLVNSNQNSINDKFITTVTYLSMFCFTLLSGIITDRFGRRNTIMFGLITLGIYSVLPVAISPLLDLLNAALSGISFGFMQIAYATVFGDYGSLGSIEKYFAIGSSGIFLTMSLDPLSDIVRINDVGIIPSILTIALFLSVLLLIYAPETLPEDKLRTRRIKEYLAKVRHLIESEK